MAALCAKRLKCGDHERKRTNEEGSRVGAVVKALASHQCGLGSIPGLGIICGLSLLLILYSAPRNFSPGIPVFPSPKKPTFSNSNPISNFVGHRFFSRGLLSVTLVKQCRFIYLFIYDL